MLVFLKRFICQKVFAWLRESIYQTLIIFLTLRDKCNNINENCSSAVMCLTLVFAFRLIKQSWEDVAHDRAAWRAPIRQGSSIMIELLVMSLRPIL
jgi:hypothetical protein